MYEFLFYCVDLWKKSSPQLSETGRPKSLNPSFASACKYTVISNSYMLLDAVIHTYVVMNGFELDENEAEKMSVYAKWKKLPYRIEGKGLKKSDIQIIDEIRILRNDIVHPKVPIKGLSETPPKGQGFEAINPETGASMGFMDLGFEKEFKLTHGIFLVNEVTRLLTLAKNELKEGDKFAPKRFIRFSREEDGSLGEKWPKDVSVN